jgi:hypothetical protein
MSVKSNHDGMFSALSALDLIASSRSARQSMRNACTTKTGS